jgi:PAS domain S-box-containing protein
MTSDRIVSLSEYYRLPQASQPSDFYKRLLEVVCNNATLALFIMDEHQQCIYMNPAAETLTGFSLAETQGRALHDVIHHTRPDGRPYPLCECPIDQAFPQNNREQGEEVFVHKDGHFYPVAYTASPIREGDRVTGTIIEVRDITQEKLDQQSREEALRREQQLRAEAEATQRRLTHLLEHMTDAFIALDRNWRVIYLNAEAERISRKSRSEVLGRTHWEEWPASIGTAMETQYRQAMAEQIPVHFEHHYYLPPDYDLWLEVHAYPSEDGLGIFYRNITDRKRAEVALSQSEFRYQTLVKNIPGMVYRYAPDTGIGDRFTYVSSGSRDLFELEPDLILQDPSEFWSLVHPEDVASLQVSIEQAVVQSTGWEWEGRFITPSGKMKWIQGKARMEAIGQGKVWDGLLIDITDRKQAETERERLLIREKNAREDAETANRIKDEFLAVLSHELRSPLNPILGWTKLLQTQTLDQQKTQQALATIERNAKLQTQLIEDLLDVSRILRGKLTLNTGAVNLLDTIEAAMETVRLAVDAKAIDLCLAVTSSSRSLQVMGDAARLQQVVWNLLSNAVKFTPTGGRIEVKLETVTGHCSSMTQRFDSPPTPDSPSSALPYAQITVSDTGKGIAPDFLPYVFDYFRQEDGTTTRKFGGLGLGLAIVRHITELHGGTVRVESAGEGQGATFTVQLPLPGSDLLGEQEETADVPCLAEYSSLQGVRVLAVDDDADIRELIEFVLQQAGATVCAVSSASEVLQQIKVFAPDVLISDIGMPEMDGYMLMRQIRTFLERRGILAIALTAYAGEINQQQAMAAGFRVHLAKPIEPKALIEAIEMILNRNRPL